MKFIEGGFVQVLDVTQEHGHYTPLDVYVHAVWEHGEYLDGNPAGPGPLLLQTTDNGDATFEGDVARVRTITVWDSPNAMVPLEWTVTGQTLYVDGVSIVDDFTDYVVASTTDPRAGDLPPAPNAGYWSHAYATWQFDGSGSVDTTNPYTWHGPGADTPKLGWTAASPWSQPPHVDDPPDEYALQVIASAIEAGTGFQEGC